MKKNPSTTEVLLGIGVLATIGLLVYFEVKDTSKRIK